MGAPWRRNLIANKRRTDDDEDEGNSQILDDFSSSQGSVGSHTDEDGADGADKAGDGKAKANGNGAATGNGVEGSPRSRKKGGAKHKANGKLPEAEAMKNAAGNGATSADAVAGSNQNAAPAAAENSAPAAARGPEGTTPFSSTMADTTAMLNGMELTENIDAPGEINFDELTGDAGTEQGSGDQQAHPPAPQRQESFVERRRREHEEYKKKRDEDPSFVPNRGGFFMHDHRTSAPGANGFRPSVRGRGRGRGGYHGGFSSVSSLQTPQSPADAQWSHDLHETVANDDESRGAANPSANTFSSQTGAQSQGNQPPQQPFNRSFSKTTHVGNVQMRLLLPTMKEPIVFSGVPVNSHSRLPQHRPPLRRDKPVRISLPDRPPRYIFPIAERSFIFIPRAMRPNQQGYRGRGRGSYGGMGNFPSTRSQFGGSVYTPSIAMSRRSSFSREIGRDTMISPAGSVISRHRSAILDPARPIVRLPPAADGMMPPMMGQGYPPQTPPMIQMPMIQGHLEPQNPLSHESLPATLPMHQPSPQKAVPVADFESSADKNLGGPNLQPHYQQPFHQQMPVNGQVYPMESPMYATHSRHPSHPSQHGTPLSNIPERAVHANAFQPYGYPQPYYPQQFAPPGVYMYPQPGMAGAPPGPYMPQQQPYTYMMPQQPPQPVQPDPNAQAGGTVAHESNGMVYYFQPSQLAAAPPPGPEDINQYAQAPHPQHQHHHSMSYGPPPMPAPNGYMMPPPVYYPQQ